MMIAQGKMARSKQVPKVGRKRTSKPPKSLSPVERKFALRLSELIGDNSVAVAERVGVSPDAVRKWCSGRNVPSLELWPKIAAAVGLKHHRDLLAD
jgi:DNA-binding transcriptional regulator YiaG